MKKHVPLFLIGLFFAYSAYPQDKKFTISTNLLNLAVAGPSLALNYKQNSRLSFQLYGSAGDFRYLPFNQTYSFKTGILDLKYTVFEFLYVGTYLRYIEKQVKREGYVDNTGFVSISSRDFQGKGLSSGLLLGVTMVESRFFNLETFAGAGYGRFISQKDISNNEKQNGFVDGRIGLLAGFKF
ncbi:DUF3575 domain-containing protein [Pedobacter sp. P351]|uniref:DUF3575 domain-containing protein n=1 Tax=Pedobacter superstes TaxID=3133441 RepID=UPI0030A2FF15